MVDRDGLMTRVLEERWLTRYYFARTAFSAVWVALAISIGERFPIVAAALLVVYPAWDALANYIDASRSGGMAENRTQAMSVVISLATTVAVIAALRWNCVLGIFGMWAVLAGLLQLATAVRRWQHLGAQWAMILSGGQSALAGVFFLLQARMPLQLATGRVAGYAAVGAVYFLVSAVWLSVGQMRSKRVRTS
ncbi:DUF308 domain-containing protein [Paraburkholderia phymatum]|uniref:Putative transmembrane protein n=1 Tax=Paraburkholderia phymatum (strain DSM 17167 / CIP 108236 / LMG 21445 / STM815) TaxID=391038 RepID=B2JVF1_PARP8|nr:hypothetical protein [Paraburkholderia phymatum]ACC74928.1 putative transmembrane protein [Paraburkholderia phymatum STM815]